MTFQPPPHVDLGALAQGTPCLTPAVGANLAEAAAHCLENQGHQTGAQLAVDSAKVEVKWHPLDPRSAASRADLQSTTEEGAVAIALALIRNGTAYEVVRRSRKGTGFDWYLGPSRAAPPFMSTACLEVSGILRETADLLERRAAQKVAQAQAGGTGLPGFAVVVGFAGPRAIVRSLP